MCKVSLLLTLRGCYYTRFWTTAIFSPRAQRWRLWVKGAIKRLLRKTPEKNEDELYLLRSRTREESTSFIMERVIITFLIIETSQEDNVTRIIKGLATKDLGIDQLLHAGWHFGLEIIWNGQIKPKWLTCLWIRYEIYSFLTAKRYVCFYTYFLFPWKILF